MSETKVGVVGASGRVGKEITQILKEKGLVAFFGIYSNNIPQGYAHTSKDLNHPQAKDVDIWIDFSLPESFEKHILQISKFGKPVVSGTTGLNDKQKEMIKEAGKNCPLLWSSNMSLGVAVLTEALEVFKKIKHFDFQIEEFHHNKKKDAPSGTAVSLQNKLVSVVEKDLPAPVSIRGGGIFGIHKIWAMSDQETLTFEHQALNRRVFAEGAVFAAVKLQGRPSGVYSMRDVL